MKKNMRIRVGLSFYLVLLISAQVVLAQKPEPDMERQLSGFLPASTSAKPVKTRSILVFNVTGSYYHSDAVLWASEAFKLMGQKTGAYLTTESSDPAVFSKTNLSKFDAIVLNNSQGEFLGEESKVTERMQALVSFVADGKGLIALHATTAFSNKPGYSGNSTAIAFREMIGGALIQHPWNYDELTPLMISVEDTKHKVNAAFKGQTKWLLPFRDEIFQFGSPLSRDNMRVLLSLSIEETPDKGSDPNKDYPLAWIKNFGKGRVFYSAFGHSGDSFQNKEMLSFLLAGTQFALGDLKADVSPVKQPKVDLEKGFVSIFNGKNLDGWRGDSRIWSVEDNCITGQTTLKEGVVRNNFLIWEGGALKDFDLKAKFKLVGGNSGFYFHSYERTPDSTNQESLVGVQADFAAEPSWVGTVMEYTLREILVPRGRKVVINEEGKRIDAGAVGDPVELLKVYKPNDWNDYHVIVRDNLIVLRINDVEMSEIRDYDRKRLVTGLLALQTHVGPPMKVQFKDIRIKKY
jgi:type 1 glutamine amidotransferase